MTKTSTYVRWLLFRCVSLFSNDTYITFLVYVKHFEGIVIIIILIALQELLPPSNTTEYTHHLAGMMHDLDSMKTNVSVDSLILCSHKDSTDKSNKHLTPGNVQKLHTVVV